MTPRELVKKTLEFKNTDGRVPLDLWTLPWAETRFPEELAEIRREFDNFDIVEFPNSEKKYRTPPRIQGNAYVAGAFVDEWNVTFQSIQSGVFGEVKDPLIPEDDEDWENAGKVHFPEELLTIDTDAINAYCERTDKFVLSSDLVRPFERLQFIRGTENLYCDIALDNPGMREMLARIHDFNCRLFELWAKTDVDGLFMMDDWGSQQSLLINPETWRALFKPLYKTYVEIAHSHGKKMFFHSDGYTLDIIPDLIEIGVDAANLQIFCIGVDKLAPFQGKITFWGEMDRQKRLVEGPLEAIDQGVRQVYDTLWSNGGLIGQCEFGAGAKPQFVHQLYRAWRGIR